MKFGKDTNEPYISPTTFMTRNSANKMSMPTSNKLVWYSLITRNHGKQNESKQESQ